jgi:putative ABC transport system ATP-binding protein
MDPAKRGRFAEPGLHHYAYYSEEYVLRDVTLELDRGQMYVLFGPSGCGKTTLLSLMGGLDTPKKGRILFQGQDIQEIGLQRHRRNNVSFVFQNYNLIDYLTPLENVALTARKPPREMLEKVGLTGKEAHRSVLKLSGGEQQRVAIARALASDAPVVLADEPTGNLDQTTAMEITALLKQNARALNKCVVVVSHSGEVAQQADVVFELSGGAVKAAHHENDG